MHSDKLDSLDLTLILSAGSSICLSPCLFVVVPLIFTRLMQGLTTKPAYPPEPCSWPGQPYPALSGPLDGSGGA